MVSAKVNSALPTFLNFIRHMDRGELAVTVFLYFQKAFDKVPKKRLLHKFKDYGLEDLSF